MMTNLLEVRAVDMSGGNENGNVKSGYVAKKML